MDDKYWQVQKSDSPLFPDVLWSRPERRDAAGTLAIIGGNSHGFAAVAAAQQVAMKTGVGEVKIILPKSLQKAAGITPDVMFAPANSSGGLAHDAANDLRAAAGVAGALLFIGDNGNNSETAQLFENFLESNRDTSVIITRDAVDLLKNAAEMVLNRDKTHLVVSLSQLQKLTRAVYYPRIITFSQGAKQIAETLHKLTISYPITITLWHDGNLFVAHGGEVISQPFDQPLRMWSGEIATRTAVWSLWNADSLQAAATAWADMA